MMSFFSFNTLTVNDVLITYPLCGIKPLIKNASVRNVFTLEDAEKLLEKVETSAIEALKLLIYWESLAADIIEYAGN